MRTILPASSTTTIASRASSNRPRRRSSSYDRRFLASVIRLVYSGRASGVKNVGYFRELMASNPDINDGLRSLLRLCRETVVRLGKTESALVRTLQRDPLLFER